MQHQIMQHYQQKVNQLTFSLCRCNKGWLVITDSGFNSQMHLNQQYVYKQQVEHITGLVEILKFILLQVQELFVYSCAGNQGLHQIM